MPKAVPPNGVTMLRDLIDEHREKAVGAVIERWVPFDLIPALPGPALACAPKRASHNPVTAREVVDPRAVGHGACPLWWVSRNQTTDQGGSPARVAVAQSGSVAYRTPRPLAT